MKGKYRTQLPQLNGDMFLTDAGIETDLIFNYGIEIREFAAHTLLPCREGRDALKQYYRGFLELAREKGTGFILDSQTWKAHMHWAQDLEATEEDLRSANEASIEFISDLRDEFPENRQPVVLNGIIGPRGDAYAPEAKVAEREAEEYHSQQIGWLADTEVDMVTAMTLTQATEAVGMIRAAGSFGLPVVISFTVETDGCLPTGQPLEEAITEVDTATDGRAAYFMINCAHPDHFFFALPKTEETARRIRGLRCNASRLSHAELDECEVLDSGDPVELASYYRAIHEKMPWLNVFGGCCGSDLRHVTEIAHVVTN